MVYKFKDGARSRVKAQVAGEFLEALREKHGGSLTPGVVLLAARPKRSPIHEHFEWDDTRAARAYRLAQARYLVHSIVTVYEGEGSKWTVRAFVHIENGESSYTSMAEALSDVGLRQQVLGRAKKELEEWRRRYRDLEELAAVFAVMDQLEMAPVA